MHVQLSAKDAEIVQLKAENARKDAEIIGKLVNMHYIDC